MHLSYKLSDALELQLNYSKRTRRPEAEELNPFPEYRDLTHVNAGNANLLRCLIDTTKIDVRPDKLTSVWFE